MGFNVSNWNPAAAVQNRPEGMSKKEAMKDWGKSNLMGTITADNSSLAAKKAARDAQKALNAKIDESAPAVPDQNAIREQQRLDSLKRRRSASSGNTLITGSQGLQNSSGAKQTTLLGG